MTGGSREPAWEPAATDADFIRLMHNRKAKIIRTPEDWERFLASKDHPLGNCPADVVKRFTRSLKFYNGGLAGADHVFSLAAEFQGHTAQGDILSFVPAVPVDARFVRVETVSSPSWVAWSEIKVYA